MDDYVTCVTDEAVAERRAKACAERGCLVVVPEGNQLQVDIDTFAALGTFHANVKGLGALVLSHACAPSPSRKAGRFHITVTLCRPVKDHFERIALQCLLGSDISREAVSWREASLGLAHPTVFFELLAAKTVAP